MNRRGQHLMEYAMTIAVVTLAMSAMGTYVRRAIQARVKAQTDYFLVLEETDLEIQRSVRGDLDGDDQISIFEIARVENFLHDIPGCDVRSCDPHTPLACRVIALPCASNTLSLVEQRIADMNGDGTLNWDDVLLMRAMLDGGTIQLGDLDGDGIVSLTDSIRLTNFVYGRDVVVLTPADYPGALSPIGQRVADLDGNGTVDGVDLTYLRWLEMEQDEGIRCGTQTPTQCLGTPAPLPSGLTGDLNGDGQTTPDEYARILDHYTGRSTLSPQEFARADLQPNGRIDGFDVAYASTWAMLSLTPAQIPRGHIDLSSFVVQLPSKGEGEDTQWLGAEYERASAGMPGDLDGNGSVQVHEIIKVVGYKLGTVKLSEEELDAAEVNGDGNIDISDIIIMINEALGTQQPDPPVVTTTQVTSTQTEIGAMHNGDLNGDGQVTIDEILRAVNAFLFGGQLTSDELVLADTNGNNQIDIADLVRMILIALGSDSGAPLARHVDVTEDEQVSATSRSTFRGTLQLPLEFQKRPRPIASPNNPLRLPE